MKLPLASLAGIVVIILYCTFTFSSLALFSGAYSPVTNWLSDLGNSGSRYNPRGAILYNIGAILTGIALFPFFIGFYKWYLNKKQRKILLTSQVVGCLSALALIMSGIFSEDSGSPHFLWSAVFFLLNILVMIMSSLSLFRHPQYIKTITYYGFIVIIVNLALIFIPNTPLLEWFTVFTALGYVGMLAYNTSRLKVIIGD